MNDKKNLFIQIVKGILVFLLFRFSVYLQYIPIYLFKIDVRHITASMTVLLSCFSNILLVIMLWFIYRKELKAEWKIFRSKLEVNLDTMVKYWTVGLVLMMFSNMLINLIFSTG